jgi:hypothetical protein
MIYRGNPDDLSVFSSIQWNIYLMLIIFVPTIGMHNGEVHGRFSDSFFL